MVLDVKSYTSILNVPEHVNLAVVATPARSVPVVVEECGQAGVVGVVIISAGFKEIGEEGTQLEREISRIRKKYGMRILGPNCLGFVRPTLGLNATFLQGEPPPGNIAFISQSGALGSAILDWAVSAGIGFSMFASLGSMIDVDFGDIIDFLGHDGATRSILIYMEGETMSRTERIPEAELEILQQKSFSYFLHETNTDNGLVIDKTAAGWPASIAATGLALAAYPVAVERGFMSRAAAVERTLATLRFFWNSPQGPEPDATGYQGFYYHFLDMRTGRRAWQCELSTIDSTFLLAGALTAGVYFDADTADEIEIRTLADTLYRRADWQWAQNHGEMVMHGWKPESGFLKYRWEGYDEAMLLYILGLGSPAHSMPESCYAAWASTYRWECCYGIEYLYAGPLFTHQLSHVWIDFRGIQDAFMRVKGIDYFENSRRATYVQQQYAVDNPLKFAGYGPCCWGITASDGPGPDTIKVSGIDRQFFDYLGRGVPYGPDDGTLAPWSVVTSLPFAPEIVLPAIDYFIHQVKLTAHNPYGFKATFNPTYPVKSGNPYGWVSPWHYGLNQGPIVLMIENYRTGLLWRLMRDCPYIADGLRRAGFSGGWL